MFPRGKKVDRTVDAVTGQLIGQIGCCHAIGGKLGRKRNPRWVGAHVPYPAHRAPIGKRRLM